MASQGAEDDLAASKTEGYKIGEKKTLDEYTKLDENDESLNRWKASLGLATGAPLAITPGDTRRCIIQTLALEVEDRPDIVIDLTTPNALETLKQKPFIIKEGSKYRTKATFKVQHDILTGLKYIQLVKRKGIRVGKDQEMLGSYAPNTVDKPSYEVKFHPEEAPSGMLVRGNYNAISRFVDDDDNTHLQFEWSFVIAKDWSG